MIPLKSSERRSLLPQVEHAVQEGRTLLTQMREAYTGSLSWPLHKQKQLIWTGFFLAVCSILIAWFPLCGVPFALVGGSMSLAGYRFPACRKLAACGFTLAVVGMMLSLLVLSMVLGTYITHAHL